MIDVDYGDGILLGERKQVLVEGTAAAEDGEFVVVGERVGGFDQGRGEDQGCGGYVGVRHFAYRVELEPQRSGDDGPHKAGLDRLACLDITVDEEGDGGCEPEQNTEWDRGRPGVKQIDETIFRTAQHSEDYRFEEEQPEAGSDSGDGQATFAHLGERDEVQGDQEGG